PNSGIGATITPPIFAQDLGRFTSTLSKTAADGSTFSFGNNTNYEGNIVPTVGASPFRAWQSDWTTNFEAIANIPLMQGRGVQYNRIAGPMTFDQYAAGFGNPADGVIIARIRTDETLADFEGSVRDLLQDVELSYWDLYFRYR